MLRASRVEHERHDYEDGLRAHDGSRFGGARGRSPFAQLGRAYSKTVSGGVGDRGDEFVGHINILGRWREQQTLAVLALNGGDNLSELGTCIELGTVKDVQLSVAIVPSHT
jgi:hypothetical protein